MIRLSICIPTYNFGKFIDETLESILSQRAPDVEIVVLDGGSTDNTAEIVKNKQRTCPQLKYFHQDFRGGIDKDIETVVGLAEGRYCWLFSADDIMVPGAIAKVLDAIASHYDVYLCEHDLCTLEMDVIKEYPIFKNIRRQRAFDLGDVSERREYFHSARTSEAFFSFLAGPIFKKSVWDTVSVPESFYGKCWIVAGHLLGSVSHGGITVKYLGEKLLHKREGNDSFAHDGIINRYRIAIEYFQHIADVTFGRTSEEAFHIRRVLQSDVHLRHLLLMKLDVVEKQKKEDKKTLDRLVKMHYADRSLRNWMRRTIYQITPVFLLKVMRWFRNGLRDNPVLTGFLRRWL